MHADAVYDEKLIVRVCGGPGCECRGLRRSLTQSARSPEGGGVYPRHVQYAPSHSVPAVLSFLHGTTEKLRRARAPPTDETAVLSTLCHLMYPRAVSVSISDSNSVAHPNRGGGLAHSCLTSRCAGNNFLAPSSLVVHNQGSRVEFS